jgi:hypothetical protein
MDSIREKQYENLRKKFNNVIKAVLGDDYYNLGGDVYSCDAITCEDIIREYKQVKKERDTYRKTAAVLSMLLVLCMVCVHLFIL